MEETNVINKTSKEVVELTDDEVRELLSVAEFDTEDDELIANYVHTDYRCHYHPESNTIYAEQVCINQDGQCFGIGLYATIQLEDNQTVNWHLNWTDISVYEILEEN